MTGKNKALQGHLCIFTAEVFWGLMSPLTKDAIGHGVSSIAIVTFRVLGAAILFWLASFFIHSKPVPRRDILKLAAAALLGIVANQCLFTVGIGYTSPINSSIVATSMPIFAMILSFFILGEPITWRKAAGVGIGLVGAVVLILSSASAQSGRVGDIRGDLMCMAAQFSFALYLSLFNPLIKRYDTITVNKWMFLFSAIAVVPFTFRSVTNLPFSSIPTTAWLEVLFIVVFGTCICYVLSIMAQKVLRPTVVSIYNYVQPIVSVLASVLIGLGVFTLMHALAIGLVFIGVWMVTKSKSKRDLMNEKA